MAKLLLSTWQLWKLREPVFEGSWQSMHQGISSILMRQVSSPFDLSQWLWQFQIMMRGKESVQLKQTTLDVWACSGRMHCD